MKKLLLSGLLLFCGINTALAKITLEDIVSLDNWHQKYHTQTLKVCPNDLSMLCWNGQSTGLKLKSPGKVGDTLTLTDSDIPKIVRRRGGSGGKGTGGGSGGKGTGGGSGGASSGITAGTVIKAAAQVGVGLAVATEGVDITTAANAAGKEKKTWGDVATSAGGTAATVGGAAAVINAIPGLGQVTYMGAVAVGATIGALATGRKMFSETDCNRDPVRQLYACCNISNLSNIEAYRAEIGQEMWTENFPYVSTCLQGGKPYAADWGTGLFLDDAWSKPEKRLCSGYEEPTDNAHVVPVGFDPDGDGKNICWGWECEQGFVRSGTVCVSGEGGGVVVPTNNCVSKRTTDEGKACCYLAENVAKWDGKNCVCTDGLKFEIVSGKGVCKPVKQSDDAGGGATFVCPAYLMPLLDSWRVECAANTQIVSLIDQLKKLCADKNIDEKEFDRLYSLLMAYEPQNCNATPAQPDRSAEIMRIRMEIQSARRALDNIAAGFKTTVWKTADGKFNTSRLLSDSVAGVVLGTTGALVTSHIVKKNQIENGFEDISCTVGGQVVAGWADQFRVGIQ